MTGLVGELWHWQVQQTLPYWTRRRRMTMIAVLALVLAGVIAVAVLPLARADLHPVRSADELTARYGGTYHEEVRRHPDYAATSTSWIWIDNDCSRLVMISTSTYPSAARAALAYRYWSPMRASWVKPWYEPVSKPYRADLVRVAAGTEVRGLHCAADNYPFCGTWVFWQIEDRTVRETQIIGKPFSYEDALAEFAWVGVY